MPNTLDHYLHNWELSQPRELAHTATSHVYTVTYAGETAVLKLLTPLGAADEAGGALALRYFTGQGAVRLLRADAGAHLLEYAGDENLFALAARGDDDEATRIIADVLRALHAPRENAPPAGLTPLRVWFRALFHRAEAEAHVGEQSLFVRAARLADSLLAQPRDERVLHGDIHHYNIHHSARGWLAFDPKGLYGERTYDAANTLCNPNGLPQLVGDEARLLRSASLLAEGAGLERARVLAFIFAYAALSAAWSDEDGGDSTLALRVARLAEAHLSR